MAPVHTPSDAELLRESRRRPDAFVEVCARHADGLTAWLRRDVGQDVAEELLAETLARAWLGRRRFRDPGDGSAGAWLFGIARNLVRDYRRRGAIDTRARRRLDLPTEAGSSAYADADDRMSAQAEFVSVAPLLDELPPEQRAALELRVVDELDYAEIGEHLDVNEVTARTRVHRALRTLRARTARSEG